MRIFLFGKQNLALSGPEQNYLSQHRRLCLGCGGEVHQGAHARLAVRPGEEEDRRPVPVHHVEGGEILRTEAENNRVRHPPQVVPRGELLQGQDPVDLAGKEGQWRGR